jgi:hypothetical protein
VDSNRIPSVELARLPPNVVDIHRSHHVHAIRQFGILQVTVSIEQVVLAPAQVVVPGIARVTHRGIRVPGPITLDNLGGRLSGDVAALDRVGVRGDVTRGFRDTETVIPPLDQVTVAISISAGGNLG